MAMERGGSVRGVLNDNMVGWLYEDHGADREYKNSPVLRINAKGWVDNYRIPKYLYYLTRANYVEYPVLFIQPHNWRIQLAFPSYKNLNLKEQELVYKHIARITPYVDYDPNLKTFRFEKEKMLLIPSPEVNEYLEELKE
jgi:hypothetical protein